MARFSAQNFQNKEQVSDCFSKKLDFGMVRVSMRGVLTPSGILLKESLDPFTDVAGVLRAELRGLPDGLFLGGTCGVLDLDCKFSV